MGVDEEACGALNPNRCPKQPNNPENDGLTQVSSGVGQGEFGTDLSGFLQRIDKNRLIRNQLIPRSSRAAAPRNQAPGQQNSSVLIANRWVSSRHRGRGQMPKIGCHAGRESRHGDVEEAPKVDLLDAPMTPQHGRDRLNSGRARDRCDGHRKGSDRP